MKIRKDNLEKYFDLRKDSHKVMMAHIRSMYSIIEVKNNEVDHDWIDVDDIAYILYRLCQRQLDLQLRLNLAESKPKVEPKRNGIPIIPEKPIAKIPWYKKLFAKKDSPTLKV